MQQHVLRLIGKISDKAAAEEMDEVEKMSESLHALEVTFVKMFYAQKKKIGDEFKPVGGRTLN